jgi:hypothetical protein
VSSITGIPIYANRSLILDLAAGLIDGYIESTSYKKALALTGNIRANKDYKVQETSEDKLKVTTDDESSYFDGKADYRNEFNVKNIYTTFYFLNNVREALIDQNLVRNITEKEVQEGKIKGGEYVEFAGNLSTNSLCSIVATIIDILSSYDIKALDELIKNKVGGINNCSSILNQLKSLSNCLNRNNTTDIIMDIGSCCAVLDINNNNFSDKNAYVYDTANTQCRVLCKVIKYADKNDFICLLRKTAMSNFYNEFLTSLTPYLKVLNDNGILMPDKFITRVYGAAIQVIPIAMYI